MLTDLERWPGLTSFAREWLGMDHVFGLAEVVDCPAGRHLIADFLGNHDWARDHWGALVRSMELVAEGRPPLVGVLGWRRNVWGDGWTLAHIGGATKWEVTDSTHSEPGWTRFDGGDVVDDGPESGQEGLEFVTNYARNTYWLVGGPKEEG